MTFPRITSSSPALILPNLLFISDFGIVTILCSRITESIVNPVPTQWSEFFMITKSLSTSSFGILLEIKAIITWSCKTHL